MRKKVPLYFIIIIYYITMSVARRNLGGGKKQKPKCVRNRNLSGLVSYRFTERLPRIPLRCGPYPSPSPRSPIIAPSTANGPANVLKLPPPVHQVWAWSWTAATAAEHVPNRWGMFATRKKTVTIIVAFTVITVQTSLGTKKEYVRVSVLALTQPSY